MASRGGVLVFFMGATMTAAIFRMTQDLNALPTTYMEDAEMPVQCDTANRRVPLQAPDFGPYKPAPVEKYVLEHAAELKFDVAPPEWTPTCQVYTDPQSTPYHAQLQDFIEELDSYYKLVNDFDTPIKDLRRNITEYDNSICDLLELYPGGMPAIFNKSQQLSHSSSGWLEPLIPPMRHPRFCFNKDFHKRPKHLIRTDYLLHDFQALCKKLKPTSRTVFVDMGASLVFHKGSQSPVLDLIQLFGKFGFNFDHVYAYEYKKHDPENVFKSVPDYLDASYHWINVGVTSDTNSRQNPFKLLQDYFEPDDLIIVKLDIDTPKLERQLAQQLLDNPQLGKLIDHFYFEHHVNQEELAGTWGRGKETVADSMNLFQEFRKRGIPAHFWV